VAELAGVSRLTIYYQFGSKAELLEALFDRFAARGGLDRLPEAFRQADPLAGLDRFIEIFCGFWESDRIGIRRVHGWTQIHPESGSGVRDRDAGRRKGLSVLVKRIRERYGVPARKTEAEIVDLLHALTSFETYDDLARGARGEGDVARILTRTARQVLGIK
jgi:AcrR family transcriptional regulator